MSDLIGTNLLALACAPGQGSVPPATVVGGVYRHQGSGMPTPDSAVWIRLMVPSKRRGHQLFRVAGLGEPIADVQGSPPRGVPV